MEEKKEVQVHPSTKALTENLSQLLTPEGIQRYFLGVRKDGQPRAVYDVIKDYVNPKKKKHKKDKKKNKKHKKNDSTYSFYVSSKKKKKHKKKNKKDKYWHIDF